MGWQVIPQPRYGEDPEQLYAIFSSGVDAFVYYDCTKEEIFQVFRERAIRSADQSTEQLFEDIEKWGPRAYAQFGLTWEQALRKNNSHTANGADLISDMKGDILYEDTSDY